MHIKIVHVVHSIHMHVIAEIIVAIATGVSEVSLETFL